MVFQATVEGAFPTAILTNLWLRIRGNIVTPNLRNKGKHEEKKG
jgi:hypothetical protein